MARKHSNSDVISRGAARQYVTDALLDYADDALTAADLHRVVDKRMVAAHDTRTVSHQTVRSLAQELVLGGEAFARKITIAEQRYRKERLGQARKGGVRVTLYSLTNPVPTRLTADLFQRLATLPDPRPDPRGITHHVTSRNSARHPVLDLETPPEPETPHVPTLEERSRAAYDILHDLFGTPVPDTSGQDAEILDLQARLIKSHAEKEVLRTANRDLEHRLATIMQALRPR